jgi:hypothetical protein
MPNVVCMGLQDAQNRLQLGGVFRSRSEDATGRGRRQILDANWVVVEQQPAPGAPIGEGDALLSAVKDGEPSICTSDRSLAESDDTPTDAARETAPTVETPPAIAAPPAISEPRTATVEETSTTPAAPLDTVVAATGPVPVDAPATAPPTSPVSAGLLALDVLTYVPVELEQQAGYDRHLFAVWRDLDRDGCDTRAEVLINESLSLPQVDPSGCAVVAGDWYSRYDALTFISPAGIEIDHVVALKEAWDSGAWAWQPERQVAFGNDLTDARTLIAVSAASNHSKGDRDSSNWLPVDPDVCRYIGDWIAIKIRWSLSMDESEWGRLENLLNGRCAGTTIEPWDDPPVAAAQLPTPTTTGPPPAMPLPLASVPRTTVPSMTDPQFGTCKDAKAHGHGPYRATVDPEYGWYRDADHDGIVCE